MDHEAVPKGIGLYPLLRCAWVRLGWSVADDEREAPPYPLPPVVVLIFPPVNYAASGSGCCGSSFFTMRTCGHSFGAVACTTARRVSGRNFA